MWLFIIYDSYILKLYNDSDYNHISWNMGQRNRALGTFPVNIDKILHYMATGDWVPMSNSLLEI